MTDLNTLLGNNAEAAPSFKPFSEWSQDKLTEDPVQLKIGYSDYIRESYIQQGKKIDLETEQQIQTGLYSALVQDKKLEEGDLEGFEKLIAPPDVPFEEKVNLVRSTLGVDDPDMEPLRNYWAMDKVLQTREEPMIPEIQERYDQLRANAEEIVNSRYNDVKRYAVRDGALPFAVVTNENNERELLVSDTATKQDLASALKNSKVGGVNLSDAYLAQYELETPEGFNAPRYKLKRFQEATEVLKTLAKDNQVIGEIIDGQSTRLARKEYTTNDRLAKGLDVVGEAIVSGVGKLVSKVVSDEQQQKMELEAKKKDDAASARRLWSNQSEDEVAANVSKILAQTKAIPDAESYSLDEIKTALNELSLQDASGKGKFELHTEEGSYGKNIRISALGTPVLHPAVYANEDLFNKSLDARADIDNKVKAQLTESRTAYLTDSFQDTSKVLARSNVSDKWNEALIAGRQEGKKNYEILNDFLKDGDNYNEYAERLKGVGSSIAQGVGTLALALPAALGSKTAQDWLVGFAQSNADRREVANLFGAEMGFGQDIAESIAPLIVDVTATLALSSVTMGAGGAAYLAAKQGAKLTAKGLLKSVTSSAFKIGAKGVAETAEEAAARVVADGLIKGATKEISGKTALAAIDAYNGLVAKRIGSAAASFIPAATRSGASTYGSVFLALSNNKELNLTREEIHDRALGAAFSVGAVTGVITSAFGAFGKAGVEDALLRGLSYKQAKSLLGSLANTKNLTDDVFKDAVKKQLAASLKKYQQGATKGILTDIKDEAQEEGLDELLNGFVEDAALNENTPMLDRLKGAFYAAAMGGTLGGGVSVLRQATKVIKPNTGAMISDAARIRSEFISDVTKRLNDSGSPITAKLVQQILSTRVRSRAGAAPVAAAEPTQGVPPVTPLAEGATPVTEGAEAPVVEGAAISSESTPIVGGATPVTSAVTQIPVTAETPAGAAVTFSVEGAEQTAQLVQVENGIATVASSKGEFINVPVESVFTTQQTEATPAAPIVITPEAQTEIDLRTQEIETLSQPIVGNKNAKRAAKEQKRIEQLKREVEHIQQTGSTTIPKSVSNPRVKKQRVEAQTPVVPEPETTQTTVPDITSADQLIEKIAATPQAEADRIIRSVVDESENPQTVGTAFVEADSIHSTFEAAPVEIAVALPQSITQAAVSAGIDPNQVSANQVSHVSFFAPDQNTNEPATKKRKPYVPVRTKLLAVEDTVADTEVEFDITPFQEADQATDAEREEAAAVVNLAKRGFPVRFNSSSRYGAVSNKNMSAKSDFLANVVYTLFPVIKPAEGTVGMTKTSSRKRTYFDPAQNKTVTGTMKMPLDKYGRGVFNNDPVLVSEMLAHGIPVYVPSNIKSINKAAFVIKNNYVIDVRMPSADGTGIESAVTLLNSPTELAIDNSLFFSYSNIPFYPDGVEGKVLPEGVRTIDPRSGDSTATTTQITFGELQKSLFDLLATDNLKGTRGNVIESMLNQMGSAKLDTDFRDNTIQSSATEFLFLAHLFELRGALLSSRAGFTIPSPKGVAINPTKKKAVLKQLSSRLKGNPDTAAMAEMFLPLLKSTGSKKPTNTDIVVKFVEDLVLNNKDFDGNVMPPYRYVMERTRSRYLEQQKARGINEKNKATVSLDVEGAGAAVAVDAQQLENFSRSLGGFDPTEPLSESNMFGVVQSAVSDAVNAIDSDSALRDALNDLAFQSVYRDPDAHVLRHVQNMSSKDLMARIGQWMTLGNHATNPNVLEFIQALSEGGFESGIDLRNALRINAIGSRIDGNPAENADLIKELQRQLSDSLGQPVSESRARNFIKSMDTAVRRRLSRAVVDKATQRASRDQNADDIARLGLVSGDPESVINALQTIAKSNTNPSHKLVAELLLEDQAFIRKVSFSFGASMYSIAGEYVRHTDGTHSVYLNTERGNGLGLENVLLEEYVHAFLSDTLTKSPDELSTEQRTARKRLEGLYQLALDAYNLQKSKGGDDAFNASLESGLENIDEFVANFLLDPEFQKFIKTLEAPAAQRGFFQRIIDALVSMFRKITRKENTAYAQALEDIIDLSKTTIRATAVPFKQQAASNTTNAANSLKEVTSTPRASQSTQQAATTPEAQASAEAQNQAQEEVNKNLDDVAQKAATQLPTQRVSAEFVELIKFMQSRLPYGVTVTESVDLDGAAAASIDGIIINPAILMDVMIGLDPIEQRGLLESIINEELGHTASFSALTDEEINEIAESLSDADFEEIASVYFAENPERRAKAMANLVSDNPATVKRQKEVLVEEKLRMRLQEITRGYTTEQDAEFWRSKPSLLAILKRYIGGVINKYAYSRRLRGGSGAMDAALFSLIQEMEAISLGFARTKVMAPLDTDAPAAAIETYNRILNRDILAEIEDVADAQDSAAFLATSVMPLNVFSELMERAGLKLVDGIEFRDVEIEKAPAKPKVDTTAQQKLNFVSWASLSEYDEDDDGASMITKFENAKGIFKYTSIADIRTTLEFWYASKPELIADAQREIEQAYNTASEYSILEAIELETEFNEEEGTFTPLITQNNFIPTLCTLAMMEKLGASAEAKIPMRIGIAPTPLSLDGYDQVESLLVGEQAGSGMDSGIILSINGTAIPIEANFHDGTSFDVLVTNLNRAQNILSPEEPAPDAEPTEEVNMDELIKAITSIKETGYSFDPIVSQSYSGDSRVDVDCIDANGVVLATIDFNVYPEYIKIGLMTLSSEGMARSGLPSFSKLLMESLIANNQTVHAKKIKTLAAGDGRPVVLTDLMNQFNRLMQAEGVSDKFFTNMPDLGMNGYYSWPTQGFGIDPDKTYRSLDETIRNLVDDLKYYLDRADGRVKRELDNLDPKYREALQQMKDDMLKRAKEESELLIKLITTPEGVVDLMYGLHEHPDENVRKTVKGLWRRYGSNVNVVYELADASRQQKAFTKRIVGGAISDKRMRIEQLDEIRNNYRREYEDTAPEDVQDLKDKYNKIAREAGSAVDLFTSVGQRASASSNLSNIDFSPVVQLLEMPMFEYGAYKAPTGWLNIFRGDLSKPMKRMIEQRDEFKRAASKLVISYKEKMDELVIKAYGDKANVDWDLLAQAQGYISGNIVSDDTIKDIEQTFNDELEAINLNKNLSNADKKIERAAARQRRDDAITTAEDTAIAQITVQRDAALKKIGSVSGELAAHIVSMREKLIQPIQQKLIAAGIDPEIGVKIDKTGGIYITRAYEMFNDPTYADRVRNDPAYAPVREAAMKFFTKQLRDTAFSSAKERGLSDADATKEANDAVLKANKKAPQGSSYGAEAMRAFLASYDGKSSPTPQMSKGLKVAENNLKRRKDLPKELRDLLGEYGATTGTDLIVRTFSTVAMVAAQQTFLNNLATTGIQEGFFVDAKTYAADPSKYPDYAPVRSGSSAKSDPLKHMYAPKELIEVLGDALNASFVQQQASTAEKAVGNMAKIAQNLTGKAMVIKTLGSVGFYLRNMLGNMLFFAPAQGFYRSDKVGLKTLGYSIGQMKDPNKIDAYLTELTGLGIIGDELQAGTIRELLNGKTSPDSLTAKLDELTDQLPVIRTGKKGLEWLEQKATDLSGAIDAAFKIEYYEHELEILKRAQLADPNSTIGKMSPYDLKRMAADKVKMTSQSLSQAPPIANALTKSGFGLVFAPFIRFKMEVPRIIINTYKLGIDEARSDNAVIRSRGRKRLGSMTVMLGGISAAAPAVLSAVLGGVGDEEDEALRKSMPEYLRGHSFWIIRNDDGSLRSLDLTYLNPFSLLTDPIMRALPKIMKGDVGGTVAALIKGFVFDTYLDDQILAGNLSSALNNKDATTEEPIWIEGVDESHVALGKALGYILEKTYTPRLLQDTYDAYQAVGGDYTGAENSPLGQLIDGVRPVKVHTIDLEKQYRRYVFEHIDKLNAVNKKKYALYGKQAVNAEDIDDVYAQELEGRRKLNQELLRVARGFETLGLDANTQFQFLKSSGVGKEKARLLFFGIMDRPDINKEFAEGLVRRGYGERLNLLYGARNQYNRYIFIEDPK